MTIDALSVPLLRLDGELELPAYAHADDAGMDLRATVDVVLEPGGGRALVPTGIAVAIPPGHGGFVVPRSGLAARQGVTVLNGPGLVDPGYRGEVQVPLVNTDPRSAVRISRGDRIAQLVVVPVARVEWTVVDALDEGAAERGVGGFGSSGR